VRRHLPSLVVAVAVAAMVALAFAQRWHVLASSPYPLGIDGYFYPVQVRALLAHGSLQYPSSPLTFWWMAPFVAATDPITGCKLAAALGGALIAIPAYGVGARLGKGRGAGLVCAALASASAGGAYLSIEFVKQGIGLTVALAALWSILVALDKPPPTWKAALSSLEPAFAVVTLAAAIDDPTWWTIGLATVGAVGLWQARRQLSRHLALAALLVVAAFATHKLAAAFVTVVAAPAVWIEIRQHVRGRRLFYVYIALGVGALALFVAGLVAPHQVPSIHDLGLVADALSTTTRWSAPALVAPGFELAFDHEAMIGGIVALVAVLALFERTTHARPWHPHLVWWCFLPIPTAIVYGLRRMSTAPTNLPTATTRDHATQQDFAIACVIVASALVVALPWLAVTDPQGLGFRLRVAAFVPLALCAAIVARALLPHVRPLLRDGILAAVATASFAHGIVQDRTEGEVLVHPALAAAVMAADDQIPSNATVIVPERHILFMVAWYTRAPVSLRPDPIPYAQRVRMFGLVFIGQGSPLDHALDDARVDPSVVPPIGLHPRHRNGLVLVTEPTWDWLLARMPSRARAYFSAWPTI
jgi:hypothetical protein